MTDAAERSPVPSDRDPWPGEAPFTAWGQHGPGMLDLRVFDQGVWWVDIEQQPHRLRDMPDDYLVNVERFLLEHREYYHRAAGLRWRLQEFGDRVLGRISSEVVARAAGDPVTTRSTR